MNTILLVEDNPHIMKINHTALMMEGYRVLEATCAAQCLTALDTDDVDLIVLDIMLPDGNGVVSVSAADDGSDAVAFTVCDNGSGISAEDLPHIFERGYSKDGGDGLGLTICREIIESAGGTISVEKTGAEGTTVRFTVPAEKEDT